MPANLIEAIHQKVQLALSMSQASQHDAARSLLADLDKFIGHIPVKYQVELRSKTTFQADTQEIDVYPGQDPQEVANRVARGVGATVSSVSPVGVLDVAQGVPESVRRDAGAPVRAFQHQVGCVLGDGLPDFPGDLKTFAERSAYQRGVADERYRAMLVAIQAEAEPSPSLPPAFSAIERQAARKLAEIATAERRALLQDGLSVRPEPISFSDVTDELYHAWVEFEVQPDGESASKLSLLYSLGYDGDSGLFAPYVEVGLLDRDGVVVRECRIGSAAREPVPESELLDALDILAREVSEARVQAFAFVGEVSATAESDRGSAPSGA